MVVIQLCIYITRYSKHHHLSCTKDLGNFLKTTLKSENNYAEEGLGIAACLGLYIESMSLEDFLVQLPLPSWKAAVSRRDGEIANEKSPIMSISRVPRLSLQQSPNDLAGQEAGEPIWRKQTQRVLRRRPVYIIPQQLD